MSAAQHLERLRGLVPEPASRGQATAVVVAAAAFIVYLGVHSGGGTGATSKASPGQAATASVPTAVSPEGLAAFAASTSRPVYWVGPRQGVTYELTRTSTGNVLLRYLPRGVRLGDSRRFLTVGTYPFKGAFAQTVALTKQPGAVSKSLPNGGVAVYRPARPTNIYVAYPGLDFQIEVFSPSPAQARGLVADGELEPVRAASAVGPTLTDGVPAAVSPADLRQLSVSLGQPVYWLGPRSATRLELTRKGRELFLRYLPPGTPVGSPQLELTVGTYSVPDAFQVTSRAAAQSGNTRVDVGGGAVAFYRPSRPQNVYLAYPGQDFQIEVYDPDAAQAVALARSSLLRPVR